MQKKYLYFLAAAHLCCDINMGALPAMLPFFVSYYNMDYTAAAGLMFAGSFLASLIQPVFGYLADRVSRPWFMASGVLITGIALGLTGFLTDYWLIFTAVTFMGIGSAIFHPEAARLVNRLSGGKKGMGMSIFSVGGNGGFGLGPLLAIAVVSLFSMQGTIIFAIIACIMSTALFFLVPLIKKAADEITQAEAKISLDNGKLIHHGDNDWSSFGRLTLVIVCRSASLCAVSSFLPLYCVHVLQQSNAIGSSTLTILSLIGIFTTLAGGFLADKFGYIRIIKYCMITLAILLEGVALANDIFIIYALLIPLGFAMYASYSSCVVLGQTYLAKNVGFASGVTLGLSVSIGGVIVPFLGYFADSYGLTALMQLVVIITLLGSAATLLLPLPPKAKPSLHK